MQGAVEFIEAVFGRTFPKGLRVELWNLHTHLARSIALPDAARAILPVQPKDTYVSVGYTSKPAPKNGRTKAANIAGIPALWLDLDVNGGPDDKRGSFESMDAAIDLACRFVSPTILVNSGYGVHAWWVLEEPWVFADDLDRARAQRASHLWQQAHRTAASPAKIDSTHDLARLMRLPGTFNGKAGGEGVPVSVIQHEGIGTMHALATLLEYVGASVSDSAGSGGSSPPVALAGGALSLLDAESSPGADALVIDTSAEPPQAKFEILREISIEFDQTWLRTRKGAKFRDWSHSEWDMALASLAAYAGWSEQEVADLLAAYRKLWDPGGDKAARADYIPRTVRRVFDTVKVSEARIRIDEHDAKLARQNEETQVAAIELADLGPRVQAGEDVSLEALDAFNRVMRSGVDGAPRVVSIVQTSEDPTVARYTLTFHDGRELVVAPRTLISAREFAVAVMATTRHVMPSIKGDYWTAAIRVLLQTCEVHEAPEASLRAVVASTVESHVASAHGSRADDVVEQGAPFIDQDGQPRFTLEGLLAYMGRKPGSAVARGDVAASLRSLGWKAKPVTYRTSRGVTTSKSYYQQPEQAAAAGVGV